MDFFLTGFLNILNLIFSIVILIVVIKLSYIIMKLPLKNKSDENHKIKDNLANK
ncbi:hypothetical protein [Marinitoga aeolica]|uniref:Uncharacterized protein n=1 Tax=Marinitoga aeolica TaxID=2809031 RepID=A0ABY8PN74_9BACT|nr:hypothetical protein [Marinitoga aeolica]WGS64077.1 hypothetical protein JRV97_06750 [Marinitoga aeolica]